MVDLFSSELPSWENWSVEAQANISHRSCLLEIPVARPPRRDNPDLNKHLHVHRRTKPWPWVHSLPSLNFCRYAVAVLIQRPWPDHVAKRIVAFLALGQLGGDRRLCHEGSSSDQGSKSDGGAESDNPTAESAGGDVPVGFFANCLEGRKTSAAGNDIASQARCAIGSLGKGDIIFQGEDAGVAQCFFQERASGNLFGCAERCDNLGAATPHIAWPMESVFLANS